MKTSNKLKGLIMDLEVAVQLRSSRRIKVCFAEFRQFHSFDMPPELRVLVDDLITWCVMSERAKVILEQHKNAGEV